MLAKFSWALLSDAGPTRVGNEDYAGVYAPSSPDDAWDRGPLFLVADGMGGHAAGEVASRTAVDRAVESWSRTDPPTPPAAALRSAIRAANLAVYDAGLDAGRHGMGTTLTALTFAGREALLGHVGDTRAYRVHAGRAEQLTQDHSRVGEMLRMRLLTPEQAAAHPARSVLTRTLGAEPGVVVDIGRVPLARGDVFCVCSDGVWEMLTRQEFAELLTPSPQAPLAELAEDILAQAAGRGAPDNLTVILVRVHSDAPIPCAAARRGFFRRGG